MRAGFIALALTLGYWFVPQPAAAGVAITTANTRWETSAKLGTIREPVQLYGALGSTGDARFFQVTVKKIGILSAAIDVPVWADPKFHPQLVVYQPDSSTTGPALSMVQPPGTIALVYPLTEQNRHFEAWTQITAVKRLQAQIDLPVTGTYYLAVYNADRVSGRFRLTLTQPTSLATIGMMSWPKCWWISQMWANPSITTPFAPLAVLAIILVMVWMVMHWTRPVRSKQNKRKTPAANHLKKSR